MRIDRRSTAAAALALAALLALALPVRPLAPLDAAADRWFAAALGAAGAAYATSRVLNGSISVLKESELQLEPAGIGVTLAVGQILDPLDDMTERFSDVVVTAIVALGVQRVLHRVTEAYAPALLAGALVALALTALTERARGLRRPAGIAAAAIVGARLALPLAAVAGEAIHARVLAEPIEAARAELAAGVVDLDRLTRLDLPSEEQGLLGAMREAGSFVRSRVELLARELAALRSRFDGLVHALLTLSGLYVAAFLLQGVLLPLGALGVLVGLGRAAARWAFAATPVDPGR